MGAYQSTPVIQEYAPTDSGERPKNYDYYNGTRYTMIPIGLYPHYRRGWWYGGFLFDASENVE